MINALIITLALSATVEPTYINCGLQPLTPLGCNGPATCVCDQTGECGWQFSCGYGGGRGGVPSIPNFAVQPPDLNPGPLPTIQPYDVGKVLDALRAGQEDQRKNEEHQMRMRLMQQQLENMQRQGY
jgi:hypothetical protein